MQRKTEHDFVREMRAKSTKELVDILNTNDSNKYPPEAFAAIKHLLLYRDESLTIPKKPSIKLQQVKTRTKFSKKCNAKMTIFSDNKVEIKFPLQGTIMPEKNEFNDIDDLLSFLSARFHIEPSGETIKLKMRRVGKYQRFDENRNPIFTFGDPILDLLTDENGIIKVGKELINFRKKELSHPKFRKGGIQSIDFGNYAEYIRNAILADVVLRKNNFSIIECNEKIISFASINPSEKWFYGENTAMRFRSWIKDWNVYASIGSEIETWRKDFEFAEINSKYANIISENVPHICALVKTDYDSDKNDNYVDEYEWAVGFKVDPPASSVHSICTAIWNSRVYRDTVQSGPCQLIT